jgi:hypothetical protein
LITFVVLLVAGSITFVIYYFVYVAPKNYCICLASFSSFDRATFAELQDCYRDYANEMEASLSSEARLALEGKTTITSGAEIPTFDQVRWHYSNDRNAPWDRMAGEPVTEVGAGTPSLVNENEVGEEEKFDEHESEDDESNEEMDSESTIEEVNNENEAEDQDHKINKNIDEVSPYDDQGHEGDAVSDDELPGANRQVPVDGVTQHERLNIATLGRTGAVKEVKRRPSSSVFPQKVERENSFDPRNSSPRSSNQVRKQSIAAPRKSSQNYKSRQQLNRQRNRQLGKT